MIAAILIFRDGFVMPNDSDYQKTIAITCRDFLVQVDNMPEFNQENDLLDGITMAIIDEGDEDLFHLKNLESHLHRYESKLLSMYSKNPDNNFLDALYRRAASLRGMCTDFIKLPADSDKEKK